MEFGVAKSSTVSSGDQRRRVRLGGLLPKRALRSRVVASGTPDVTVVRTLMRLFPIQL
jgi:hypothetical protein